MHYIAWFCVYNLNFFLGVILPGSPQKRPRCLDPDTNFRSACQRSHCSCFTKRPLCVLFRWRQTWTTIVRSSFKARQVLLHLPLAALRWCSRQSMCTLSALWHLQPKVIQTVQQHVSDQTYFTVWITRTFVITLSLKVPPHLNSSSVSLHYLVALKSNNWKKKQRLLQQRILRN